MPNISKSIIAIVFVTIIFFLPWLGWYSSKPQKQPSVSHECISSFISENGWTVTDVTCRDPKSGIRREIVIRYVEENEE